MADWFAANAPTPTAQQPQHGGVSETAAGDWFSAHAPQAEPTPEPDKPSGAGAMAAGAGLATLAAGVPLAKWMAERVATSPIISGAMGKLAPMAGSLNVAKLGYDVVTNPMQAPQALYRAGRAELTRQGAKLAYRTATPVAEGLGAEGVAGMAAPLAVPLAGGLAGLAGTAGFLGMLQHDANRKVDIDYSKHTLDTDVAKVFTNMQHSEANRGRTRDERMDDPNDVMFQADDAATVTTDPTRTAILAQLRGNPR